MNKTESIQAVAAALVDQKHVDTSGQIVEMFTGGDAFVLNALDKDMVVKLLRLTALRLDEVERSQLRASAPLDRRVTLLEQLVRRLDERVTDGERNT